MTPEELQDLHTWRRAIALRMQAFEEKLDANTATTERVDANTREIVETMQAWKGAMKVIEFLGKLAKPLAAIVGLGAAILAWRSSRP